jgi:uncharacterized protein YhaN
MMHGISKTFALGAVLALAAIVSAQEGVKQTERLIKLAEDTAKQIGETKVELQKTLETYNTLVRGGSGDAKKLYNDLRKAVDRCEKKREGVRKRSADMEQEAHTFFEEWTASLAGISNEDLKQRSQTRLNAQADTMLKSIDAVTASIAESMNAIRAE